MTSPPRGAVALLRWAVGSPDRAEGIVGDLTEEFEEQTARRGRRWGSWWFWTEALKIALAFRFRGSELRGDDGMDEGGGMGMSQLWSDVRLAVRGFARTPGFTLTALVTLALGVGANSAMFSVVHGVLLRPLPYPEADRVVDVWPDFRVTRGWIRSFQAEPAFGAVSGVWSVSEVLNRPGDAVELQGVEVNASYMDVLGLRPALGRWFRPEDELVEARPTVVLSHDLWVREFGASEDVLGQVIPWSAFGITEREVIGVMSEGLEPLRPGWEFWVPVRFDPELDQIDSQLSCTCWTLVARLEDGTSAEVASERTRSLASRLRGLHPDRIPESALVDARIRSIEEGRGLDVGTSLLILFGAVTLVLLVACVNVANLLLARSTARRPELSVRGALGASRGRLMRQLMTESVILALGGGLAGAFLAHFVVAYVRTVSVGALPLLERARVDAPVLLFTLGVALATSVVFGTLPAYQGVSRAELTSRGRTQSRERGRISKLLVASEVALAVVLVTAGSLLYSAVSSLMERDIGFPTQGLTTVHVRGTGAEMRSVATRASAFERIQERLAALPGVDAVGATTALPLSGVRSGWQYIVRGRPLPAGQAYAPSMFRVVTPAYHSTVGVGLVAGRYLADADEDLGAEVAAVVNRSLARVHWTEPEAAVGEYLELNTGAALRIVGVVEDVRHISLVADPQPTIYVPQRDFARTEMFFVLRSPTRAGPSPAAVRAAIADAGIEVLVRPVRTMEEVAEDSVLQARLYVRLMATFAGLALVLGLVGIYGVTSYGVSRRRREFGVRMALGASPSLVMRGVASSWAAPLGAGLAIGMTVAVTLSGMLSALVYGVETGDPHIYGTVILLLSLVGAAAILVPAARATHADPTEAMRAE